MFPMNTFWCIKKKVNLKKSWMQQHDEALLPHNNVPGLNLGQMEGL